MLMQKYYGIIWEFFPNGGANNRRLWDEQHSSIAQIESVQRRLMTYDINSFLIFIREEGKRRRER